MAKKLEEVPPWEEMSKSEYEFLSNQWPEPHGLAWENTGEICLENGWMDHFGFVTPSGAKAMERYEARARE